ncbi:type I restriction modification DNA specificity domain protein [Streptococcus sp. AS14]|uniref:restriction endonuclease subunit S n=1 Tax=Streptococcus TaxID=1301 RepID=UPI0002780031|nr:MULTISPECIES: restriction endonuclease subunit S [Streptococcus]EJO20370.1 type I restriction modification DNA specificity domain protein [Streptococcus sp. AS14]RSI47824.1 EcoKI restriction-modification system protein HsdS [Streptococcus sanguinis]
MTRMKESGIDWIGQIPEEWEVAKVNHIFEEHKQKNRGNKEKNLLSLSYGRIIRKSIDSSFGLLPESFDTYNIIQRGDIVLRLTDLQNDKRSLRVGLARENGIITSAYLTLRLKNLESNDSYMYYLLHTYDICKVFYNFGGGVRQGGTWSDIYKMELLIPPCNEQQKIADYLDKKIAQLDRAKRLLEKQIQKLKDYRASLIYETVTKGLDKTVPMKDSGIDWIGQVPEGWKIGRVKDAFKLRSEKNFRPIEEVQLLSLYTEFGVFPHGDREEKGNKAVSTEGYKIVYKKDIVVNIILAWMGSIGISEYDGVTSPAYDIYEPLEGVCSKFFHYLFRTEAFAGQCYKYGKGIMKMRWRTYSDDFKTIEILIPDYNSQVNIVKFLDNKLKIINQLIDIKQEQIENINKQRQTLIYDYVTGKRRV